jgi:dihydrolipoamide dehydrogenase
VFFVKGLSMGARIIIIGGGPGGYAAAIRAAQLGAEVIIAEKAGLGGTCLNAGCVPTKALLHTAKFYRTAAANAVPGVRIAGAELDWPAAQRQKQGIIDRLADGIDMLLRRNGVTVYNETAVPLSSQKVRIGDKVLSSDAIILALGSVNAPFQFPGVGHKGVIDSAAALSLENVPESIVIVGGGVIGVEFATLFSFLGAKTTIIEIAPRLLPSIDAEIADYMKSSLELDGITVHTGARLKSAEPAPTGLSASFETNGLRHGVTAEKLLLAIGRRPNTTGLGLEKIGVKMTNGAIDTDSCFRTNIPGLYAVGDCNGKTMLAHAAMAQGETAAEHILGATPRMNNNIIPSCVYSAPEIASVGITEEQAKARGIKYSIGRFDLSGNSKAIIEGSGGFMKIITDGKIGEVLGVHIVGPNATELIAETALCMSMEGTVEDIIGTIHAHPTVGESVREAAMEVKV